MTNKEPKLETGPIASIIIFVAIVFMVFGFTSLIWNGLHWTVQHFGF